MTCISCESQIIIRLNNYPNSLKFYDSLISTLENNSIILEQLKFISTNGTKLKQLESILQVSTTLSNKIDIKNEFDPNS